MKSIPSKKFKKPKIDSLEKTSKDIKKKIPFTKLVFVSFFVNILIMILIFFFRERIPPEVPLFYGLPEGENQLAQQQNLYLPSLITVVIIFMNSAIAYYTKDEFIKKTLIIAGFAITFLSAITTIKIAFLVGNF